MSAERGVTRTAVKLPLQSTAAVPERHCTAEGTTVEVPVSTIDALPAVRACTVSLNVAVAAPVRVAGVASVAVGAGSTGPAAGAVTSRLTVQELVAWVATLPA